MFPNFRETAYVYTSVIEVDLEFELNRLLWAKLPARPTSKDPTNTPEIFVAPLEELTTVNGAVLNFQRARRPSRSSI